MDVLRLLTEGCRFWKEFWKEVPEFALSWMFCEVFSLSRGEKVKKKTIKNRLKIDSEESWPPAMLMEAIWNHFFLDSFVFATKFGPNLEVLFFEIPVF